MLIVSGLPILTSLKSKRVPDPLQAREWGLPPVAPEKPRRREVDGKYQRTMSRL